ncbi:MAG: class I SAM-dependent RNA methyltransferase, partial [Pseudomonadota bacterium]
MNAAREVAIRSVGAAGDGLYQTQPGAPGYIPFALPGERWRIDGPGAPRRLTASADRVEPTCRHFGRCGGCALQHWADDAYAVWKRDRLVSAIRRAGFDPACVQDLVACAPASRRRVAFAMRQGRVARVGFQERGAHRLIDISDCPVTQPVLAALPAALRRLPAMGANRASALATDSGVDLVLALDHEPDAGARMDLAAFADAEDLARLSVAIDGAPHELVAERRPPTLRCGGAV